MAAVGFELFHIGTVWNSSKPHRRHLFGVAYRMLGTSADAEDAVQEAWLRLRLVYDAGKIDDLRAWSTTVVGRICLDQLRSARVRREAYVGPWLPEPILTDAPADGVRPVGGPDPESAIELDESVRMAMLVVLEELSPEQRVAFVLHDVFAMPFNEVAETLGVGACQAAARQHASRARRIVADAEPPARPPLPRQRQVADEFIRACATGDLEDTDQAAAPRCHRTRRRRRQGLRCGAVPHRRRGEGRPAVPRAVRQVPDGERRTRRANGDLGLLVTGEGIPTDVTTFAIGEDGRIVSIFNQVNPDKLRFGK